ncbi:hypothetical protein A3C59_03535 [Candidatus Daviesbacteria bacterium RIFCSPHIGHO2_02_FULL_36_13]|uniref:Methyltransferase domain-containing protein n=1 Tax=Candidatus Daviesbacteria bacterium RIFCSPHIGHO2_02_FULL_36_13 TaxID=1797768 RepID=A0A1F5JPZ7_9BACT|nr:MAG: hypothetical protein A3C59_03535 [Candidatus Daviesbacteria bacterium RIFCSPHIGHO2_02_FULL_36_13]
MNKKNMPKAYLLRYVEFYKLKFKVTPDVLIPRPETELLIDEILKFYTLNPKPFTLVDIGTGSGNIAVSIAKQLPTRRVGIRIVATDISNKALKVAKQNAKFHGVENRITFIESNLLSYWVTPAKSEVSKVIGAVEHTSHSITEELSGAKQTNSERPGSASSTLRPDKLGGRTQLIIVANLPYIPTQRIPTLDSSVKDFEPHLALDGGPDGFDLYRNLFAQIKQKDWNPALIVCEIDYTQESIAKSEPKKYFPGYEIEVKKDLAKNIRILKILTVEGTLKQ